MVCGRMVIHARELRWLASVQDATMEHGKTVDRTEKGRWYFLMVELILEIGCEVDGMAMAVCRMVHGAGMRAAGSTICTMALEL